MLSGKIDIVQLTIGASAFILVFAVWIGVLLAMAARRAAQQEKVKHRLGLGRRHGEHTTQRTLHLWHEGRQVSTTVEGLGRLGFVQKVEKNFQEAGWDMGFGQVVVLLGGIFFFLFAFLMVITGNWMVSIGAVIAVFVIFRIVLFDRIARREALFEVQLLDALELAARSLRAGHPLLGAFHLLSEEMQPPISQVFNDICQRHGMGANLEQLLREAGDRSSSADMKLFATSVAIQIRTGGNLADLMDRLAAVIRDRMRLQRRVRVLTAQTQMSKRILIALPFVLFILLNFINPKYMAPFYNAFAGKVMLAIGIFLLAVGAWIMNKMVQLKY
jgi:tight adherence protein B